MSRGFEAWEAVHKDLKEIEAILSRIWGALALLRSRFPELAAGGPPEEEGK